MKKTQFAESQKYVPLLWLPIYYLINGKGMIYHRKLGIKPKNDFCQKMLVDQ